MEEAAVCRLAEEEESLSLTEEAEPRASCLPAEGRWSRRTCLHQLGPILPLPRTLLLVESRWPQLGWAVPRWRLQPQ